MNLYFIFVIHAFLNRALQTLRSGGRLIVVDPEGDVDASLGRRLEDKGYARILVETAVAQQKAFRGRAEELAHIEERPLLLNL